MSNDEEIDYTGKTVILKTKRGYTGWKGKVIRKSGSTSFRQYVVEVKKPNGSVTVHADPNEMIIVEE